MKLLTAKVVDGQVDLPPGTAAEGVVVTLLVPDGEADGFELTAAEKSFLLESIEQANQGEVVDGWGLLEDIRPA